MLNVLLIENNISYGKKLINALCTSNELFRLAGIVNTLKETKFILNNQKVDIILLDVKTLNNNNLIYEYLLNNKNKENIILICEKKDLTFELPFKYILREKNIKGIAKSINSILSLQNSFILKYPSISEEILIKSKIEKELILIGYNLEHLGTTYIIESIYILYSLVNYHDNNLARDIYSLVAKKYGKNINNIKCNIGNATNMMYFNTREESLNKYFCKNNFFKPTPRKVIFSVLNKIKKDK